MSGDTVLVLLLMLLTFVGGVIWGAGRAHTAAPLEKHPPVPLWIAPPIGELFEYIGRTFIVEGDGFADDGVWCDGVNARHIDTFQEKFFTPRQWCELVTAGRIVARVKA